MLLYVRKAASRSSVFTQEKKEQTPVKQFTREDKPWIKIALESSSEESTHFILRANFLLTRPIVELAQRIKGVSAVPGAARYEMLVVMNPLFNYKETEKQLIDHMFTHAPSEEQVMDQEYKDWLAVHEPKELRTAMNPDSVAGRAHEEISKLTTAKLTDTFKNLQSKLPPVSAYEQHLAAGTLHVYAPPMGLESLYANQGLPVLIRPTSEPITKRTPWVGALLASKVLVEIGDVFVYRLRPDQSPVFIKAVKHLGPNHFLCVPCKWQWWAALTYPRHNEQRITRIMEYLIERGSRGEFSWLDKYMVAAGWTEGAERTEHTED